MRTVTEVSSMERTIPPIVEYKKVFQQFRKSKLSRRAKINAKVFFAFPICVIRSTFISLALFSRISLMRGWFHSCFRFHFYIRLSRNQSQRPSIWRFSSECLRGINRSSHFPFLTFINTWTSERTKQGKIVSVAETLKQLDCCSIKFKIHFVMQRSIKKSLM